MGGACTFDGSPLAAYENIVVVVIQYRLGMLGYFRYSFMVEKVGTTHAICPLRMTSDFLYHIKAASAMGYNNTCFWF